MMGRRETPLDPTSGPLYDFARQLRALRSAVGLTYRQMAATMHYSASTFARAANGRALPPLDVTTAYVQACGGDVERWRRLWRSLAQRPEPGPPEPEPARPRQLLPDIADFVGRAADLATAAQALAGGARLVTVTGPPGVGKTAFAVRLAHQVRTQFPDGQLYLRLRGCSRNREHPAAALGRLLRGLGEPADAIPSDVDESAALYRSRLADRRYLVVLDDAHDELQVRPLLAARPCAVLVTSRNVLAGLEDAYRITLDVLSEAEALQMLATISGRRRVFDDLRAAQTVARLCGRLPLAIRIAGARLVARPQWTLADLGARLGAERDRLDELSAGDLGVRAAFEASYRCLDARNRTVFRRLALLPGARFSAPAVEALDGAGRASGRALQRLVDANLVAAAHAGEYTLHDLLRLYAVECAEVDDDSTRRGAWQRVAMWYARSARAAGDAMLGAGSAAGLAAGFSVALAPAGSGPAGGGLAPARLAFDDGRAALTWLEAERTNLETTARTAATTGPREAAWLIAAAMHGFFVHRRHVAQWRAVSEAGLDAALAARDRRATVAMLTACGEAEAAGGDYAAAVAHYRRALAMSRRNGWAGTEAAALAGLGAAYATLGRLDDARRCHVRAAEISEGTGDQAGQGGAVAGLAGLAREAGQTEQALRGYAAALRLHRAAGDRAGAAMVLTRRADAYRDLGRLADAATSCQQALAIWIELESRYGRALALLTLAAIEIEAGRWAAGRGHAARALRTGRDSGDRRLRVEALNVWGTAQTRAGRPGSALRTHGVALRWAGRMGLAGAEVDALLGLGVACLGLGRPEVARGHAEAALALARTRGLGRRERLARAILAPVAP